MLQLVKVSSTVGTVARSHSARYCPIATFIESENRRNHLSSRTTSDRAVSDEMGSRRNLSNFIDWAIADSSAQCGGFTIAQA